MPPREFCLSQTLFIAPHPEVTATMLSATSTNFNEKTVNMFLESLTPSLSSMGVAARYSKRHRLTKLAFASDTQILILQDVHGNDRSRKLIQRLLLSTSRKYSFSMCRLALALHRDGQFHIGDGVDLLSQHPHPYCEDAFLRALGRKDYARHISPDRARDLLHVIADEPCMSTDESNRTLALETWAACHSTNLFGDLESVPSISTTLLPTKTLDMLAKIFIVHLRLDALKPTRTKNEVCPDAKYEDGNIQMLSTRFKTRLRSSQKMPRVLEVTTIQKGQMPATQRTRISRVDGRKAIVPTRTTFHNTKVISVTSIGREEPTQSESLKIAAILLMLQRQTSLLQNHFLKAIFFKPTSLVKDPLRISPRPTSSEDFTTQLNPSQKEGVTAILSHSDADRIVVIHGPPGTGKTTVIAAAVIAAMQNPSATIWLAAQSNVAVKNIAEKLTSQKFTDYKILVSKEFHYDWHEHLYEAIEPHLVRSDAFTDDTAAMSRLLLGSRVMLCTVSMLANERMGTITRLVPVQTVIFDEASQIETGTYIPVLHLFAKTLTKMVFIGDDKQLAPYGQSEIKELESIFEKPHLRERAVFLDTQYRMPIPIGQFISRKVYGGKLKSKHRIKDTMCCRFINAGGDERKKGTSWINEREAKAVCAMAKYLQKKNLAYKIITPYDAQRALLQKNLEDARLDWENKCFNVDAFQGNEEDIIIISIVRTQKMGFLDDERRTNVMLTRCKKGMYICSNSGFLSGVAAPSLVGKLAKEMRGAPWMEYQAILNL